MMNSTDLQQALDTKAAKAVGDPPDLPNTVEPNSLRASVQDLEVGQDKRASTASTKKGGLIRLHNAPIISIAEARKQVQSESNEAEQVKEKDVEIEDLESPITFEPAEDAVILDTGNEESFTLDTFESLIRNARANNKSFLLARVTTVDPKRLNKLYFSYYAAHQINRVIFRTEPSRALLHRMRSRNPLNNMLIVGDVHYFSISPEDFDLAWNLKKQRDEHGRIVRTSVAQRDEQGRLIAGTRETKLSRTNSEPNLKSIQHKRSLSDAYFVNNQSTVSLPEMSRIRQEIDLSELEELDNGRGEPVVYTARFFATDDDFLSSHRVREYFKENSVNPDDYQIFPLNSQFGVDPSGVLILGPDGQPLYRVSRAQRAPVPATARNLYGFLDSGDHRSWVRGVHLGYISQLGYGLLALITAPSVVFLGLIFMNAPYNLYAFAGMAFVFLILALFFVNWDDHQ